MRTNNSKGNKKNVGVSMPGSRTAEPYATSTFSSFGNLHNLFHTGSTHAHSYSPWRRVPFAPHLLQLWLLTDIAVRPNRTHVKWSLLGVWLFQIDSLSPSLLFGFVGFYHFPLLAGYFSTFSFCLVCCVWGLLSTG